MSNFKGYYIKIGECNFTNPAIKREGFKVLPKIVQVTEEQRVASGKLVIKVLPHRPTKIEITFPIMTPEQYRYYKKALQYFAYSLLYMKNTILANMWLKEMIYENWKSLFLKRKKTAMKNTSITLQDKKLA